MSNPEIELRRRKAGFIPTLQPKWCKYCVHFKYEERDLSNQVMNQFSPRKKLINISCGLGDFPVRTFSSCNHFELDEK